MQRIRAFTENLIELAMKRKKGETALPSSVCQNYINRTCHRALSAFFSYFIAMMKCHHVAV
jgi:hypothetical protein